MQSSFYVVEIPIKRLVYLSAGIDKINENNL